MTRAEAVVDLTAIRRNLEVVGAVVGSAEVMAVVKANAYGHGLVPIAHEARAAGVPWLGVALLSEARTLREAGDTGPIMAWLWTPGDPDLDFCLAAGVDISVASMWALDEVAERAAMRGLTARVHLKVDTGLSRNGVGLDDWIPVLQAAAALQGSRRIEVVSVWSHLANADQLDHESVRVQRDAYEAALEAAAGVGITTQLRHLANTPAALGYPETHYDLVRIGIGMYGVPPTTPGSAGALGLTSAMTLRSELALVKQISAGRSVSYGSTWTAPESTRLGLVPVGYGDGIPRSAGNRAEVLIGSTRCSVVGRIAMDQFVVELTGAAADARAGDEVIVFGDESSGAPTADEWAQASDSIGYEVVTRIGDRVPRTYVGAR
jgi:alanine racemase